MSQSINNKLLDSCEELMAIGESSIKFAIEMDLPTEYLEYLKRRGHTAGAGARAKEAIAEAKGEAFNA